MVTQIRYTKKPSIYAAFTLVTPFCHRFYKSRLMYYICISIYLYTDIKLVV